MESRSGSFDAIAGELLREPGVEAGTGFGKSPGLRVGGKIFAMEVAGEFVVKLPADRVDAVVAAGGRRLASGTREMREWAVVPPGEDWAALAREALRFVGG